jgi:hypothetical protein
LDNQKGIKILTGASLALAILQSICTAVLTISGIRLAIGLTALAIAGTVFYAPLRWFHQDAIRIPMLAAAAVGAILDLAVLAWMRRPQSQPAAQWRRRELSGKQKRAQRLQLAVAFLTLALVGLEVWTHSIMVRREHPHAVHRAAATLRG